MTTTLLANGTAVAAKRNIRADGRGKGDQLLVQKGMVGTVERHDYDPRRARVPVRFKGHLRRTWCLPDDLEVL